MASDGDVRADGGVSEATRHVMQANKSKNTKPELLVRRALREAGLPGYRLHWKACPGKPDICYPGRKVAIFVNGCFWHRCPHCDLPLPRKNVEFWEGKFRRNRERDARVDELLVADGWTVLVVWECQLKKARLEPTIRDVVLAVERASAEKGGPGRVIEPGSTGGWRLRVRHERLSGRRHGVRRCGGRRR